MKLARTLPMLLLACGASDVPKDAASSYRTMTTGLYVPWAMAFAPDGRVFVTERPGRIRALRDWRLDAEPWARVDVIASGEAGLMGIALSPEFATNGFVYVVGSFLKNDRLVNRVVRYTDRNGHGTDPRVIVDDIPAAEFHAGSAIAFGPDGMLYVTTGDAGEPRNAGNLQSLSGKILRYTPDGTIPPDNPVPNSPVYALGVRNVQGLAWDAGGQLFATDHGPSGFPSERLRRNHDELNAVIKGRNYGWPSEAGASDDARYVAPLVDWTPGIAPSGLAVYTGPHRPWQGSVFVAGLRGRQLRRVALQRAAGTGTGWRAVQEEVLFEEELGRIRAVSMGPDGFLYFSTSNRDGRGDSGKTGDRILRLEPR